MSDVIDVDYIINEPSDKPAKKRYVVEEEKALANKDQLIVAAGAAFFAWGFSELWKYFDMLEEEESRTRRRRRRKRI